MTSTFQPPQPLPEGRLETQMAEYKPPFDVTGALNEANRCLYCHDAPCITACPTGIDIPEFIRKIGTGNIKGAAKTILSANILGHSCARVCPVEVLCQGACVYNLERQPPIQIGRLQRYATDYVHQKGVQFFQKGPPTGFKVAVIGAGPSGLACAHQLAVQGHTPVIFEARPNPGGLNTTGVAPYKMQASVSLEEVEYVKQIGLEIRYGVEVGKDLPLSQLQSDFDAVFIGVGLGTDGFLKMPGERLEGVIGATALIERIKLDPELSMRHVRSAAVIGGGNTALDVVRELRRLGVEDVTLVYRRGEAEMSGYAHEWKAAKEEGARAVWWSQPVEVRGHDRARSLACSRLALVDGRLRSTGEEFDLPVDLVVLAIGQERMAALFNDLGIAFESGVVKVDPQTFQTSNPRIFAGGDCINGGKEVVNAVADGKAAAIGIDRWLRGQMAHTAPQQ